MKNLLKNKWITISFAFIIAVLAFGLATVFTTTKTVGAAEPKTLNIAYNNLAFQDNVYIVYAVASENIDDTENIKILIWDTPQEEYIYGTQDDILDYDRTMTISGKAHAIFVLDYLSAKQMTEEVYAVAYYDGVYSNPNKYSILQYAKNKIASTDNDNLRNLLTNMLAYGASAQIYYNYNTDKLATDTYYNVTVASGKLSDGFSKGLYKAGTEITVTANAPAAGYNFKQWTDGTTVLGTNATLTYALDKNITLTAEYDTISYDINYDLDGGAIVGASISTYAVSDVETALPTAQKTGHIFQGWDLNGQTITAIPANTTGDINLTAIWEQMTFTITVNNTSNSNLTDWTDETTGAKQIQVKYGEQIAIPQIKYDIASTAERNNADYIFKGWYYINDNSQQVQLDTTKLLTVENFADVSDLNFTVYVKVQKQWAGPY